MLKKLMLSAALVVALAGQALFAADLTKVVPEGTDFILSVNVSKILSMPEVQKQILENFEKQPEQKKQFEDLKAKSGFDPLKDIHNIVLFSSGNIQEGKEPLSGALIEGRFEIEKIVNAIKEDETAKKDVEVTVVDGFNCVVPKNSKEGYGIFLDNQYVVVGSQLGVNAVKEVKMGKGKTIEASKDLVAVLSKVDSKATVSGCGLLPAALKEKCKQNPQAAALANINSFFFDFNNDSNLVLNFNAKVDEEKNVDSVLTQINGFLAMIKMLASQVPEAAEALNMLAATKEGTTVKLNLNIPAAKVAEIKAKLEERAKQMQKQQQQGNDANAPRE